MRILLYINSLSNGGAERVMSVLANGLSARGHDILLVTDYCLDNEYPVSESVKRVILVGKYNETAFGNPIARNLSSIKKLRALCRRHKTDVLVSFLPKNDYRALLAARGLRTKNLVSVRNDPKRLFKSKNNKAAAGFIYRFADGWVFQTENHKDCFPVKIQHKSCVISNPVSEVFYASKRPQNEHRHIVAVGRLAEQKNFALLIRVFARIADAYPEENLIIYGEGPLRKTLEGLVQEAGLSDRVKLPGNVADITEKIKNARLFVLSSDYEGMPNALMESMALGLPVISTDCSGGGARVLIENGENGLIVPVGDEQALANAMLKLLSDPALSERIGKAAKESAKAYMPDAIISRWEEYIQKIGGSNES